MDLNRLSRDYDLQPLKARDDIPKEDLEYLYKMWQDDLHAEQHDEQLGGRILLEAVRRLNE